MQLQLKATVMITEHDKWVFDNLEDSVDDSETWTWMSTHSST